MKRASKITVAVIVTVIASLLFGFAYDALMTLSEKQSYPQKYTDEISAASAKYGVPESKIYAVIKIESDFDGESVSDSDAYGLMQLTAETYADMSGLSEEEGADRLKKIGDAENIAVGTKYLAWLYSRLENWDTVYAAYNAGIGNVLDWLENPEYSDDGKTLKYIPYPETRNYVRTVKSAEEAYLRLYY